MGGIFFWVFGKTDRPGGLLLGQRSSSTQVADTPSMSQLLKDPFSLEGSLPSQPPGGTASFPLESETTGLQASPSGLGRGAGLVLGGGSLFGGTQPAQTTPEETLTEEETEVPVEAETPAETEATETPVSSPEAAEEGATEAPAVTPTDKTQAPEAKSSSETKEPAEATTERSQKPGLVPLPIPGLGNKPEGAKTPATTEAETPTEAAASPEASPEAKETPTANATPTPESEQADNAASPSEEEEATTAKPDKPRLGIPIPGFGSKSSETETPAASSAEFPDVPDDFWAKDYVQYFAQRNIVTGFEDGTFKPEAPMSRAAVAAQIEDAFEFADTEQENATNFEDVNQGYWAQPAIQSTNKTGFLAGYPGDVFRPERPMTRTEVLVALVSGLDLKPSGNPEEIVKVYQDADQIPAWAVEKVAAATEAGIVASYPNTETLNPNEPATRAEVSAMVYQALVQAGKADAKPSEYIVNPPK
jgi:chemotaxis protein histidine kinase CheA